MDKKIIKHTIEITEKERLLIKYLVDGDLTDDELEQIARPCEFSSVPDHEHHYIVWERLKKNLLKVVG